MILDLTDHILATSVRMLASNGHLWDLPLQQTRLPPNGHCKRVGVTAPHPLVQFLHVLPRSHIPTATKTALHELPSVSLDTAAKLGDTWLMHHLLHTAVSPRFRHAVDLASEHGHVNALRWLFARRQQPLSPLYLLLSWSAAAVDKASANGHVHVLQWWADNVRPIELQFSDAAMALAARHGHLEVLAWWMHRHVRHQLALKCRHILDHAAAGGHVEVLDWCVQHSSTLQSQAPLRDVHANALLVQAIESGHNHVLSWWDANAQVLIGADAESCSSLARQAITRAAAASGNLIALQWLASKGWYVGNQADLFSAAIVAGNLATVQWVHTHAPCPPPTPPGGGKRATSRWSAPTSTSTRTPWTVSSAVMASNEPFYLATKHGHAHLLPWLAVNSGQKPHAKTNYKTIASAHGYLDVLQWWWSSHDQQPVAARKLEPMAIIRATDGGHTHILQWWKNTGLLSGGPLGVPLGDGLLDAACAAGHVPVLEWWLGHSGMAVEYDKHTMDDASANGQVGVLTYWVESKRPLKYSHAAMDGACAAGHVHVVQWWIEQHRLGRVPELKYTQRAVTGLAMARPDVAALVWKHCGLSLMGITSLTHWGDLQFVNVWQRELGVRVDVHSMAMDWHSGEGDVAKLEYIVTNHDKTSLVFTQAAMARATTGGHLHVLEWWLRSWKCGKIGKLRVPENVLGLCKSTLVQQWWLESGLL